ncbi:hypothetical protein Tco_0205452 [Tanacetum coccineum]
MVSKASSGRGRGVKEKRSDVSNIEVVKDGAVPFVTGDSGNAAMEVELPFMVDEIAVKDKQCPVMNTTGIGSYPPLPTQVTSSAGNAPARLLDLFLLSFIAPRRLDATLQKWSMFIQNNPLILNKFHPKRILLKGRSSYTRAMIELRADVELKDNIVVAMPKTKGADEKTTLRGPSNFSRCFRMGPKNRIHKDGDGDALFQLKSDSLPHAHAQTTKTYYKHRDSRIMKAQELKTKTSAQTLIYKIFLQRYQVYQGRLLASFQDDAKYEHVGQDTRSQGGKDDQDGRIKI